MSMEIERKFLVIDSSWRDTAGPGQRIRQGYLSRSGSCRVRVRRIAARAFLTVKGERQGIARPEFEYEIPVAEAEEMLKTLCVTPILEKIRYRIEHGGLIWEIDAFSGAAQGLILAEVELAEVNQRFDLPIWAGAEVTFDRRYRNTSIAQEGAPVATYA